MDTVRTYIGVGSNVGDRFVHCVGAMDALARVRDTRLVACSRWYDTEPVGEIPQGWFLNGVAALETALSPAELLTVCRQVERDAGRDRSRETEGGPRTLDLDILLYGDRIIDEPTLRIPHPRMTERAFVLVPLVDIAPRVVHPVEGVSAIDLLNRLRDAHTVRLFEPSSRPA